MDRKIIIAIDGYSSTGKSTIARQIAKKLDYIYIDTGAMYRAVTYYALENKIIQNNVCDTQALITHLEDIHLSFALNPETTIAEICLNGETIEKAIRTLEVSNYVSKVATISEVRRKLVEQQQHMGKEKGVVMDGRDIGTVVFPNAELKLFMIASAETRAQRRYEELLQRGHDIMYAEVYDNVVTRDKIDSTREDSPLLKATDAIEIDNSDLTIEAQINTILALAKKNIKA